MKDVLREQLDGILEQVEGRSDSRSIYADQILALHDKVLEKSEARARLLGVAVNEMFTLRISSLPPNAVDVRPEGWDRDLGNLYPILMELWDVDKIYDKLSHVKWDDLAMEDRERLEAASFIHNFIKHIALWSGDAAETTRKVQDAAFAEGNEARRRIEHGEAMGPVVSPYKEKK